MSITATEGVNFTVHFGFSTTESSDKSESMQYDLNYSMHEGIEFEGFGFSEDVNETYSEAIAYDAQSS